MSDLHLRTKDGVHVQLRRYRDIRPPDAPHVPAKSGKAVLLLHGASANHRTFTTPCGAGLAEWLYQGGLDPWLLDWRGSSLVVSTNHDLLDPGTQFNFSSAAEHDIPEALKRMENDVEFPIAAIGHCMGSGVLAQAIANGHVNRNPKKKDIDCVVLLTLGLFYETPLDSRLKSEERILEILKHTKKPPFLSVDPGINPKTLQLKAAWPGRLDQLYSSWPGRPFHDEHTGTGKLDPERAAVRDMCNRLAFMYGMPYFHGNLVKQIHGTDDVAPVLQNQFGAIPAHMYIHAARNIRCGHATIYDRPPADRSLISGDAAARFHDLKVTLITGEMNRLWHRTSIDNMHAWLTRGPWARRRIKKHILRGYGHQDLLWGKDAADDVFWIIEDGLAPVVTTSAKGRKWLPTPPCTEPSPSPSPVVLPPTLPADSFAGPLSAIPRTGSSRRGAGSSGVPRS